MSCVCGTLCSADSFVVHALSCNKVSGYTWASRHALVKRVFKSVLRQYGFNPDEAEPRFGNVGPDVCFQLDDAHTLVDIVVVNPLADSYVVAESRSPGSTLQGVEAMKDHRYGSATTSRRMVFHPLAITVFGTVGVDSLSLLRKCARRTADPRGFMQHMCMALSVAVQTGNARMIMAAAHKWWEFGVR